MIAGLVLGDSDVVEKRRRQKVVPHLHYQDPFAALAWLCRVFGLAEAKRFDRGEDNLTARLKGPDGGVVMISGHDEDFKVWMRERAPHFEEVSGRSWPLLSHTITVFVDGVDAHLSTPSERVRPSSVHREDQPWGVRNRSRSGGTSVGVRHGDWCCQIAFTPRELPAKEVAFAASTRCEGRKEMPEFPAITHVALTVTSLERSVPWYKDLFGSDPMPDEETGPFQHVAGLPAAQSLA